MSAQMIRTKEKLCPFIHKHNKDCYCNSMKSQDIEKIIFFCGGSYRSCDIYRFKIPPDSVKTYAEKAEVIS